MRTLKDMRGYFHKSLKLQGDYMVENLEGAGAGIYILLQSIFIYPASLTPFNGGNGFEASKTPDPVSVFIGIDPGANGALAIVTDEGAAVIDYEDAETWRSALHIIGCLHAAGHVSATAYIEKLYIKSGFQAKSSESMVRTNGIWVGAVTMADIPYCEVLPQEWQKHHTLGHKDLELEHNVKWSTMHSSKRGILRKGSHRRKAIELLPHMEPKLRRVKDHDRADALLMALMAKDQMFFM